MKQVGKIRTALYGITNTITRFPLTVIFLAAAAILNAIIINTQPGENYKKLFITFLLGASAYIIFELIYERFCTGGMLRTAFMALTLLLTLSYYIILRTAGLNIEVNIRTIVIFFIILIAFLWIPSIHSGVSFNESFMAAFKAFFVALFFSVILFLGASLILGAVNMLITPIQGNSYTHAANIIFILYAPMHFLSLLPVYPNKKEEIMKQREIREETSASDKEADEQKSDKTNSDEHVIEDRRAREDTLRKAVQTPKLLEYLISYVIIPITAVFTVILLIYIVLNMTGKFWRDNLLEPLLVAYSITVIIVYILTGKIENAFTHYFRKIFPKVLVPIVLFQTAASVLKISDLGITYGRYYVILFGIYAAISGILFSIMPVRKNGIIAPILIVLSIMSILPPFDAFTLSRMNQTERLKNVLTQNGMLNGNTITPKSDIPEKDRKIIANSIEYLNQIEKTKDIEWLYSYNNTQDFKQTFGFDQYYSEGRESKSINLYTDIGTPVDIAGYDFILESYISREDTNREISNFEKNGKKYTLLYENAGNGSPNIILKEDKKNELIRFNAQDFFSRFENDLTGSKLDTQKARYTVENDRVILTLVARSVNINYWQGGSNKQAEVYFLVKIK